MQTNRLLTHYQIKRILGKGGMGTVYLALQTQVNRWVAIKELLPELSKNKQIRERCRNEASLMANLSNPNIVALYDYIETPESAYLIMEYVEGISLDAYLKGVSEGGLSSQKLKDVFSQILNAFVHAHEANIVHRDIKPSNILITAEGLVKVTDFGVAKNIENDEKGLTRTGMRLGTIYYMSPEQVKALSIDYRSDIYALGVVLYELLTGSNPYLNIQAEYDIFQKILFEPLPRLREVLFEENEFYQKIIDKATAKNPSERFKNTTDFLKAFEGSLTFETNQNFTKTWGQNQKNEKKNEPFVTIELKYPEEKPKKEKEILVLDNFFGIVSNKKICYFEGKDLFEKGTQKEISIKKIIGCELQTHREIPSGLFLLVVAIPILVFYFSVFTLVFSGTLFFLSAICFLEYPTLILLTEEQKKIKMKGWAWHYRSATDFWRAINKILVQKNI
ncbi:MAG: serine/threonine protein kinase [Bacteroidetes bacterium]|nr:MAG: serine/threonine protein kinase [Bacteroidota bacterium]TAG86595.1 MAG: serine/threonine protein kinase [Bacteroidota bacterium]